MVMRGKEERREEDAMINKRKREKEEGKSVNKKKGWKK